jgi:hypothetical protein
MSNGNKYWLRTTIVTPESLSSKDGEVTAYGTGTKLPQAADDKVRY